jgi:hypothetical protein
MKLQKKHISKFKGILKEKNIASEFFAEKMVFSTEKKQLTLPLLSLFDYIKTQPHQLTSVIQSKLGLNKKIFARNCEVKKIDKKISENFINHYHLMNSTQSAFNYGLFLQEELLAVASFSKGRKMNRLPEDKRSYELIRFCCKDGLSITGGLSKLVKNFCRERNAGDVMTYVDKQLVPGNSFIKAGFVKHSETEPAYYLVDKSSYKRQAINTKISDTNSEQFYRLKNSGNIKLVFTP